MRDCKRVDKHITKLTGFVVSHRVLFNHLIKINLFVLKKVINI